MWNKIIPIGIIALLYIVATKYLGIAGFLGVTAFILGAFWVGMKLFPQWFKLPVPINRQLFNLLGILSLAFLVISFGLLSKLGIDKLVPGTIQGTVAGCSVANKEIIGKSATLDINAWDMEADNPYSSAVDATCYVYKNGNSPENFVTTLSDTTASSLSGFVVGDTVYIYCYGSSYYADPVEGLCVSAERQPVNLQVHNVVSESELSLTMYDESGSTELSAGTAGEDDYTMSLGASEQKSVHAKLKVNVANNAYQFAGFGVATFGDVQDVTVVGYSKDVTPLHMKGVAIKVNETASPAVTITKDYTLWKTRPTLLKEWESVKVQMIVKAGTTEPTAAGGTTSLDGFAIIAKDATYSKGADGKVYFDVYSHDSTEADVGLDETEISPLGKQTGAIIEAS